MPNLQHLVIVSWGALFFKVNVCNLFGGFLCKCLWSLFLYIVQTTPHKRGIRNGPKALKPVPVIIRCRSCGRVKLPHYYCCSGHRGNTGEREV
ncbi:hypothetical protein ABKV19_016840 [Rosa sericea]